MSGSQWSFASILCQSRCRKGSLRWPLLWIGATGRKLNWFQRRENSMSNLTRWDAPEKFYMLTDESGTFNFLPCPVWLNLPCSTRLILLRLFLPRSVFQPLIQEVTPFLFLSTWYRSLTKYRKHWWGPVYILWHFIENLCVSYILIPVFLYRFFAVHGKCLTNTCWTVKSVFLWLAVWHGRQRRLQVLLHAICWSEGVRDLPDRRRW